MKNSLTENEGKVLELHSEAGDHAWCPSHREEVIALLTLIAAFTGKAAGVDTWIFKFLIVKAIADFGFSIIKACQELRRQALDTKRRGKE